jgi:hypothetical protein
MGIFTGRKREILIGFEGRTRFDDWIIRTYDWKIEEAIAWDGAIGFHKRLENEELLKWLSKLDEAKRSHRSVFLIFYTGENRRWKGWAKLVSKGRMEEEGMSVPPRFASALATFYFRGITELVGELI